MKRILRNRSRRRGGGEKGLTMITTAGDKVFVAAGVKTPFAPSAKNKGALYAKHWHPHGVEGNMKRAKEARATCPCGTCIFKTELFFVLSNIACYISRFFH